MTRVYSIPDKAEIAKRIQGLIGTMFRGKRPVQHPTAIITIGVQGAGKTTAIRKTVARGFVVIDPDTVTNALLAKGPLPDDGLVMALAGEWTRQIIVHAVLHKFNFVYDTALPSADTLEYIKKHGYAVKMLLVRTARSIARTREVDRDLKRGWGRPGVSNRSHMSTRDSISKHGPILARKFVEELMVCDNNGTNMKCFKSCPPSSELKAMFA